MSAQNDLDRTLGAWFGEETAAAPPPEPLARIIETTRGRRPRPTLVAGFGSQWVNGSTSSVLGAAATLRPGLLIALVALLALALAGGAVLVGSRLLGPRPAPDGVLGVFVPAADLSRPMAWPLVAPLPGGRALVIGGGSDHEDPTLTAIVYDPATGVSVPVEALTDVRAGPLVPLRDGRVLVLGEGSARVFDPTTLRLEPAGPMATARSWPAAAVLDDGRVLIAGGGGDDGELLTAELFDPGTLTFSPTGSVAQQTTESRELGRASVIREAVATLPDGRVFVPVGRPTDAGGWRIEARIYDPSTGIFSAAGTMPEFGLTAAIVLPDGRVWVVGATGMQRAGRSAVWDPTTRTFSPADDPPGPVRSATLLDDGRVLMTGGRDLDATSAWARIFDPASGGMIPIEPPTAWRPSLVRLDDGRVLAVGGLIDGQTRLSPAADEVYQGPSVATVEILQ